MVEEPQFDKYNVFTHQARINETGYTWSFRVLNSSSVYSISLEFARSAFNTDWAVSDAFRELSSYIHIVNSEYYELKPNF